MSTKTVGEKKKCQLERLVRGRPFSWPGSPHGSEVKAERVLGAKEGHDGDERSKKMDRSEPTEEIQVQETYPTCISFSRIYMSPKRAERGRGPYRIQESVGKVRIKKSCIISEGRGLRYPPHEQDLQETQHATRKKKNRR